MKQAPLLALWVAALAAVSCGESKPPAPPPAPAASPSAPAGGEPQMITVKHVLVAFQGAQRSTATRSKEAAETLAHEVLRRAKAGEDFDALMKQFSNDSGEGTYTMVNDGVPTSSPDQFARRGMVPAFGNVGFKLAVGEIGLADYHATESPFGWHVIKRVR
jgi:parvulin-like peptidyl-prolyl isomerase